MQGLLKQFGLSGHVSSHEPIRGKPYTAEVEEVHTRFNPPASARAYGKECRDTNGSVRTDSVRPHPLYPEQMLECTEIFDAESSTTRLISERTGLRRTFQMPRSADGKAPTMVFGGAAGIPWWAFCGRALGMVKMSHAYERLVRTIRAERTRLFA